MPARQSRYIPRNMPLLEAKREYLEQHVTSASPVELIQLLYQSGVQAVEEAVVALHGGDILNRGRAVTKAIEILSELQASLRHDGQGEYASTLNGLYAYMQQQLMRAHRESSAPLLAEVSRLLNTLLDGWTQAFRNDSTRDEPATTPASHDRDEATMSGNPYSWQACPSSDNRCWQF